MEEHEVYTIEVEETNIFKGEEVSYKAVYEYCDSTEEYYENEEMMASNDIAMKNAYRKKVGLLSSDEINEVRRKYGISQSDLASLLDWGQKTITRYEGHQVQDVAHDSILRKINDDPEWYLTLLYSAKPKFSDSSYSKYLDTAMGLYETEQDMYLRKSIIASYIKYDDMEECNGGQKLDLEKVIDVIRYFSNSKDVKQLYKVKLMKLLWYSDSLSYKRTGKSMTGLVYRALPMGAVPINYDLIIDLKGINYEEIDFDEGTGYHFVPDNNDEYKTLTDEDKIILDEIIKYLGDKSKSAIIEFMHNEKAYTETARYDIIQYKYANELSI